MNTDLLLNSIDLFERFPDMLFIFDEAGGLLRHNKAASDMCGLASTKMPHITFEALFKMQVWPEEFPGEFIDKQPGQTLTIPARIIVTSIPLPVTLVLQSLKSADDLQKGMLVVAYDNRMLRDRHLKDRKQMWHSHLAKRMQLHQDIACLTAHEFSQPVAVLRLEVDGILAKLNNSEMDQNSYQLIRSLDPILLTLEHLIADRRQQRGTISEHGFEAFDLCPILLQVEHFYQHRFQANSLNLVFQRTLKEALIYANSRVLLHVIIEIVSFFERKASLNQFAIGSTLTLGLTESDNGCFILDICMERDFLTCSTEINTVWSVELELLIEGSKELLAAFGILVYGTNAQKCSTVVLSLPQHFADEREHLNSMVGEIAEYCDTEGE